MVPYYHAIPGLTQYTSSSRRRQPQPTSVPSNGPHGSDDAVSTFGFLDNAKRQNVAFSRAAQYMFIVGNLSSWQEVKDKDRYFAEKNKTISKLMDQKEKVDRSHVESFDRLGSIHEGIHVKEGDKQQEILAARSKLATAGSILEPLLLQANAKEEKLTELMSNFDKFNTTLKAIDSGFTEKNRQILKARSDLTEAGSILHDLNIKLKAGRQDVVNKKEEVRTLDSTLHDLESELQRMRDQTTQTISDITNAQEELDQKQAEVAEKNKNLKLPARAWPSSKTI
ncbi:hypothetical protein BDV95DRAFT_614324 [Massariosphaeria phaeospora]|uniref:DNA2/NAM7 helicase-like C-terminal domain-containing protein n=1 Tax=Massariosphaeria phaeospora TaxID=100035 RepID=A0A7C8IH61_9PLEO|nr:hypothetical protein BDV95DRAFT_614324 [Massariosphaeria phaeospora]